MALSPAAVTTLEEDGTAAADHLVLQPDATDHSKLTLCTQPTPDAADSCAIGPGVTVDTSFTPPTGTLAIDLEGGANSLVLWDLGGFASLTVKVLATGGTYTLAVTGTDQADEFHVSDAGNNATQISSDNGTFPTVIADNAGLVAQAGTYSSLELDPGKGDDTITVDQLESSFTVPIVVNDSDDVTLENIQAPHGLYVNAYDAIAAGPALGDQHQQPIADWTQNASYDLTATSTTSTDDTGATVPGAGTGMQVQVTVDANGVPTATLTSFGSGYQVGDLVTFDPPSGQPGTPIVVRVLHTPEVDQISEPGSYKHWTQSKTYTGVSQAAATGHEGAGGTDVTGSGMTVTITVDANGYPSATVTAAGSGYAVGDRVAFVAPDGVGTPLVLEVLPVLTQQVAGTGFTDWTPNETYTGVVSADTSGSGDGLMTATITTDANGVPTLELGGQAGSGYEVGDTVTFDDPDGVGDPITAKITDTTVAQVVSLGWLPDQSSTGVTPPATQADGTTASNGSGATFTVTTDDQGNPSITLTDPGSGYDVGDLFTFSAPAGGGGPATFMAVYTFLGTVEQLPGAPWTPDESYTNQTPASTSGSGTGMVVNISVDEDGVPTATLVSAGTGYQQGDTVVFDAPDGVGAPLSVTVADLDASRASAPAISTRTIAAGADPTTAASTGDSGDIELTASEIDIGDGTQLLAFADSGHEAGDVSLTAATGVIFTLDLGVLSPYKVHEADAVLNLDGATVKGGDVTLSADATTDGLAGYEILGQQIADTASATMSNPDKTTLTFAVNPGGSPTIEREGGGSFIADGFDVGQDIQVKGSAYNDGLTYTIAGVTATELTLARGDSLVDETDTYTATIVEVSRGTMPNNVPIGTIDANGNPATGSKPATFSTVGKLEQALAQVVKKASLLHGLLPKAINAFFGVSTHASAELKTLGETVIEGDEVVIESTANATTEATSPGATGPVNVGVNYADSEGAATTSIGGETEITAEGALKITAAVINSMTSKVAVVSGALTDSTGKKTRKAIPGPALSVAYGKARSTSQLTIAQGASLTGEDVTISASNDDEFEVGASTGSTVEVPPSTGGTSTTAQPNKSSNRGQAGTAAVSDTDSHATVTVDGKVTAHTGADIEAEAHNTSDTTTAEATVNVTNKHQGKYGNALTDKIQGAKPGQEPEGGKLNAAAAVAYVQAVNQADATIGPDAVITVECTLDSGACEQENGKPTGDLSLTATAYDPLRVAAIGESGQKGTVAIGGAVAITDESNHANAQLNSIAGVNVAGALDVHSDAQVPLPVAGITAYDTIKSYFQTETQGNSPLFETGDFVNLPQLAGALVAGQDPSLAQYIFSRFSTDDQNTVRAAAGHSPHLSLTETTSPSPIASDAFAYTLTATNDGNVTLDDVTVTDPTLDSLKCTGSGPLLPGEQRTCRGSKTLVSASPFTDAATATAMDPLGGTETATASSTVMVSAPAASSQSTNWGSIRPSRSSLNPNARRSRRYSSTRASMALTARRRTRGPAREG
jgi:hypothetical protein